MTKEQILAMTPEEHVDAAIKFAETTTPEAEEIEELRICTKTGIHTCRLNSIHLNEREKSILESYLHHQLQKAREEAYQECRGSAADNHPNTPYELPELYPWKNAFDKMTTLDHSELGQDVSK